MKVIMIGDIHAPMSKEEIKNLNQINPNNVVMCKGDQIDTRSPVNLDILKNIPVKSITLEQVLFNPGSISGIFENHDLSSSKIKK